MTVTPPSQNSDTMTTRLTGPRFAPIWFAPEAGNPGAGKRPWKPDTYQKHAAYDLGKGILLRAKGGSLP